MTRTHRRRPRGVLIVGAFGMVQALMLALVGAAALIIASHPDELADAGVTRHQAIVVGALAIAIALVLLVASIGLFRGLSRVRTLYGTVSTFEIGTAVYALVALRDVELPGLLTLVVAIGVLWLLYGSESTREFFA